MLTSTFSRRKGSFIGFVRERASSTLLAQPPLCRSFFLMPQASHRSQEEVCLLVYQLIRRPGIK